MERSTSKIENIISFLQGNKKILDISRDSEMLARSITYLLDKRYHRDNYITAILTLLKSEDNIYRDIAWELIQRIPFSHLLTILKVFNKKQNVKRLRHAIVTKICKSSKDEIFRAFFMEPEKFRSLFKRLFLPREFFENKLIINKNYKFAFELSSLSTSEALKEFNLKVKDILNFHIPMDKIMTIITSPDEVEALAESSSSKTFFEHGRWFRNIIGDSRYIPLAFKKIDSLKDPIAFLSNKEHLESTGVLTKELVTELEQRVDVIFQDMLSKLNLERLALIVDISGSMQAAVDITANLYEGFSWLKITDLIAFNNMAITITNERLRKIIPDGSTSIGSAIVLLAKRLEERQKDFPQVIIIATDLEENTPPLLNDSWKLLKKYGDPTLVIVKVPSGATRHLTIPHVIIKVREFHKSLIMDIMKQIAGAAAISVKEKEITEVVKERRLIDEEVGAIELPTRDPISLRKGYLEKLLCQTD